ncbi:hypothetical protein [Arundinibacter roseus]|uniref:Lipocalin-like domain-containing protein n=1 Tax=Arundinibacter roseus TaxID=2070510 RepID=A0A4R4KMI5_9BACT|nr:hypothetical protein [Arundinibacter roseus]TDB69213.1 hypothetical protein EZE20_02445 [Arundinibacter roseus]
MRKFQPILWSLVVAIGLFATSCKKDPPPLTERIAKAWSAESVREGSTVVFTKGGANNTKPGYSGFKLVLNASGAATLTEVDGTVFTGQWELNGDTRLILKNLNPIPTGTNGTIEFTISSFEDTMMTLARTTASVKTGGTINQYTLSNP